MYTHTHVHVLVCMQIGNCIFNFLLHFYTPFFVQSISYSYLHVCIYVCICVYKHVYSHSNKHGGRWPQHTHWDIELFVCLPACTPFSACRPVGRPYNQRVVSQSIVPHQTKPYHAICFFISRVRKPLIELSASSSLWIPQWRQSAVACGRLKCNKAFYTYIRTHIYTQIDMILRRKPVNEANYSIDSNRKSNACIET